MKGLDSGIVLYALDPTSDQHSKAEESILSMGEWALNPTVVHEVYHTLTFKRKMSPADAKLKVTSLVKDKRTSFLNLTKTVSLFALRLASEFSLGGRDSLIVGSYMRAGADEMLTHDGELLKLGKLNFERKEIRFLDPLRA